MNETSAIGNALRLLRRYWIPVAVVALFGVMLFAGQPAWAADGANIGQTVPTPTPTAPPAPPTTTPAPTPADNGDGDQDNGDATGGETPAEAAPAEAAPAEAPPVEAAAEAPTSTVTLTGTVTAVTLNVRQGPAITFPVIGRLTAGSSINVLARNVDGAWLLVCCTANGGAGWVSAEFIAPSYSAAEAAGLSVSNSLATTATVTSPITGTVAPAEVSRSGSGAVDVLTLNIRQGPSTTTPVVGRFRQGNTFTVQGANAAGDWYLVCCVPGSQGAGWVSAQFVTLGDAAAATPAAPDAEATPAPTEAATTPAAEATPPASEETPAAEATPEPTAPAETAGVTDVLW
jgi:uncharacterized protein YgiM (DUF1202 family)